MIDWLRRQQEPPAIDLGGRLLPLAIRRHPRATRMTLRLAPDGSEARVTLPQWGRTADAIAFARSRADWLAGQLEAIVVVKAPGPGGVIRYRGAPLLVEWRAEAPRQPAAGDGVIRIGGPQHGLPRRLQRWLEGEALRLMAADLAHYCAQAAVPVPALALSRARRRWGSCSAAGTVRINWRLVQAPDPVRRSVVAHEVAHLVHFDHSPAFHDLLAGLFEGDLAAANRWLTREGRLLYADFG